MTDESLVGQTVAGKYQVEKILGKGGMGLVLGARHLKLDEPVAIKLLRRDVFNVAGMVTRFLREARAASKIKSEHVARVMDADTLEDGTPYMVMEYLEGIDFAELRKEKGCFDVADAVGYLIEACEAVSEAHALGIVHRDLKPANLFLARRRDGRSLVKVLDFGISKLTGDVESETTKTGTMMGSPKYMSPEQMLSMSDVDRRSDIWSLGAILYEFVAGRPPFVADTTPRVCALVLAADPSPPSKHRPGIPREIEAVILRCLEKDPNRRISSVEELVAALQPFTAAPPPRLSLPGEPLSRISESMVAAPVVAHTSVLPASNRGATQSVWNADTRMDLAPIPPSSGTRRRAVIAGVTMVGVLSGLGVARGLLPTPIRPPNSLPATAGAVPPADLPAASKTATVASTTVTVTPSAEVLPSEPPKVEPSGEVSARPPSAKPLGSAFAKKKKKKKDADPFGGRSL